MDQRIRDFEPLWNALNHPALLPQPRLERSTCEHWTLPEAELTRWFASPTVAERDAILAANRTVCRFSWNEAAEPDEEEIRLNKELHFGYETYGPPAYYDPDAQAPFDAEEFALPQAEWLQRTTGQDMRDPDQEDPVQDPNGFPAPLIAPLLNPLPAPLPAPLIAPLTAPIQDPVQALDQDDIDHYFRSSFDAEN